MKKALVVGTGKQGEKYIQYFLKNHYQVSGVCHTQGTKMKIERKYGIEVSLDFQNILGSISFDIIVLALPPDIQGRIGKEILESGYDHILLIEIPVTWNQRELEVLKTYKNVLFFLEEYVTLLAQFLRKISLKNISSIQVDIKTHEQDYDNPDAKKVTILHIQNNFIGLDIAHIDFQYQFSFHESENIFYKIQFVYNGVQVTYVFDEEKYLCIGEKKYIDDYCFDKVLSKIISLNGHFSSYYVID